MSPLLADFQEVFNIPKKVNKAGSPMKEVIPGHWGLQCGQLPGHN